MARTGFGVGGRYGRCVISEPVRRSRVFIRGLAPRESHAHIRRPRGPVRPALWEVDNMNPARLLTGGSGRRRVTGLVAVLALSFSGLVAMSAAPAFADSGAVPVALHGAA